MGNQFVHRSRRRTRFAFGSLFAGLVLALSVGVFASVAFADDAGTSDGVSALATTQPDPGVTSNNAAPDHCGINTVLVLDRSQSTSPANQAYKDAANAFVDSFVGTPSHIGMVTFSSSATLNSGYVDVSSNGDSLHTAINGLGSPSGNTNWQAAFGTTTSNFTSPVPDLVVFITDGNPTAQNGGFQTDLGAGIDAANTLKSNGTTHITGVAVGTDLSTANIAKITGPGGVIDPAHNVVPGSDVYQPATPADLEAVLANLTTQICGGTVHIHKQIQTGPNSFVDGPGWAFHSANADVPDAPVTDASGNTDFAYAYGQTGTSQLISETTQPGYTFAGVSCDSGKVATPSGAGFTVPVNSTDNFTCTVTNTPALGSITINKVTTHGVGGPFGFHVTGPNSTDSTLSATTSAQNTSTPAGGVSSLFPGSYNIQESSPAGWAQTGVVCSNGSAPVGGPDAGGNISLGVGENLVCTYTNDQLPSDLAIVKTASGPTSVNSGADQEIDYSLTVDNNGPADAHNDATVTDMLPAGATLVSVSPPAGVTCDSSAAPKITCTIPAADLEVADPAVVIEITATVPTGSGTVVNKSIVDSPDDPAPCTVTSNDITCDPSDTNNYSQASTDIPAVQAAEVVQPPATPAAAAQVEAANAALAFTGSDSFPFAGLGMLLVAGGALALVLARRKRGTISD